MTEGSAIDPSVYREVMGNYPTGVILAAGIVDDEPVGMIVGTFSSVSLDPPLVSFMPQKSSSTYPTLRRAERVAISIIAHDQVAATRTLAGKDPDKWAKVSWSPAANGAPVLDGAVAVVQGRPVQEVDAGDHWIALIAVDALEVTRAAAPLLFFQGGYGGFSARGLSAHLDGSLITAGVLAESARPQLDSLTRQIRCAAVAMVQISQSDLTVGASSYSADLGTDEVEFEERLGLRIPIVPPLAEVTVAWEPEQVESWVSRIWPPDEEARQRYRDSAARTRELGYTVRRMGSADAQAALHAALTEYGGGELAPARDRQVKAAIMASRALFDSVIDPQETDACLSSISVPVFDPADGEAHGSGLTLRISELPQHVDGRTALGWVATLTAAADEVRHRLGTTAAADYARYVAAGLRGR